MLRAVWKGAISFGLVHVPVALYPASQEVDIDFDWLDKRSMDPVGYKRVNKRTGKEIQKEYIVKGIRQESGDYVILSDEEIKAAFPKSTQTIEIESFVSASEISFLLLERPYFLEPIDKGEKVYALLREAMLASGVIAIARVVMHTKEHLAVLLPWGPALMLNTIRWASELRSPAELNLPAEGKAAAQLKPAELKMATQLIKDMTGKWKADDYTDTFSEAVNKLVDQKVKAGQTKSVTPLEEVTVESGASNVLDLTALLAKSLAKRKPLSAADAECNAGRSGTIARAKRTATKVTTRKHA